VLVVPILIIGENHLKNIRAESALEKQGNDFDCFLDCSMETSELRAETSS